MIPDFRDDGYLPEGLYLATEAEITFRFGTATPRRRRVATSTLDRVSRGDMEAMELEMMLVTRQPEEIFAAEDRRDWDDWVRFFSQTREADGRRKGIVEVEL